MIFSCICQPGEHVSAAGQTITAENVRNLLRKERHVGAFSPHVENSAVPLDLNRTLDAISPDVAFRVVKETGGNQTAPSGWESAVRRCEGFCKLADGQHPRFIPIV